MLLVVSRGCRKCGSQRMETYVEGGRTARVCVNCGQRVSLEESMEIIEAANACPECGEQRLRVTKTTHETIRGREYVIRRMQCANDLCRRAFKISSPVMLKEEEHPPNPLQRGKGARRKGAKG